MKRVIAFVLVCAISTATFAETIQVAAAISLKETLAKVAESYTADTGDTVEFTLGASGQLVTQIQNGAAMDLFISAANKQVDDLVKSGSAIAETRRVIAGNSLVLVVPPNLKQPPTSIKALADEGVAKIAAGEPRTVPAGQYAEQTLKRANVFESVKDKLVYGINVRQVLDYVERGEVSAGLVYSTDAKSSGDKVRVAFTVDDADHDPIVYPAIVLAESKKRVAAVNFLDYILSDKGQATLGEFGFKRPDPPATQPGR